MEFHQPGEPRRQAKRNCSSHSNPLSCLFRTRGTNYFGKRGKSVQAPLTYKSPGTTWIDGMTGLEPSNWRVISRRNSDTGGPVTPLNITNTIWSALTASATDTGASRKHKKTPKNKKKKNGKGFHWKTPGGKMGKDYEYVNMTRKGTWNCTCVNVY